MARFSFSLLLAASAVAPSLAFCPNVAFTQRSRSSSTTFQATTSSNSDLSRRELFVGVLGTAAAASIVGAAPQDAHAIGPVKINLLNPTYTAKPCPKDKPIPGEKAMKGMKGLCVTVNVDLENAPEKPLELVGVYGFVTAGGTGESVLANNPDGGTDAGQFAMVDEVNPGDKKLQFEFVAAVPQEMDEKQFENGIGPLTFKSLRVISFPGGQQFGSINPCEMNEFSDECDAWEQENGPFKRAEYMIKSNPRTKGY